MSRPPLIVYHAECTDGFTAAWIAHQQLPGAELWPAHYGDLRPRGEGREVYVLDFSYARESMLELNEEADSLTVLDHHKTAAADCDGLDFCMFDMSRSGAGLAWDWFHPGAPRPWMIDRIEDRDLWRYQYEDSLSVHAYLASVPMEIHSWTTAMHMDPLEVISCGTTISAYVERSIEKATAQAQLVRFDGHIAVALNVPYNNASLTADVLLEQYPNAKFSITYFRKFDNTWHYSLRSRSDFDVSEIAKQYPHGGGHQQAAGFDHRSLLV